MHNADREAKTARKKKLPKLQINDRLIGKMQESCLTTTNPVHKFGEHTQ